MKSSSIRCIVVFKCEYVFYSMDRFENRTPPPNESPEVRFDWRHLLSLNLECEIVSGLLTYWKLLIWFQEVVMSLIIVSESSNAMKTKLPDDDISFLHFLWLRFIWVLFEISGIQFKNFCICFGWSDHLSWTKENEVCFQHPTICVLLRFCYYWTRSRWTCLNEVCIANWFTSRWLYDTQKTSRSNRIQTPTRNGLPSLRNLQFIAMCRWTLESRRWICHKEGFQTNLSILRRYDNQIPLWQIALWMCFNVSPVTLLGGFRWKQEYRKLKRHVCGAILLRKY